MLEKKVVLFLVSIYYRLMSYMVMMIKKIYIQIGKNFLLIILSAFKGFRRFSWYRNKNNQNK